MPWVERLACCVARMVTGSPACCRSVIFWADYPLSHKCCMLSTNLWIVRRSEETGWERDGVCVRVCVCVYNTTQLVAYVVTSSIFCLDHLTIGAPHQGPAGVCVITLAVYMRTNTVQLQWLCEIWRFCSSLYVRIYFFLSTEGLNHVKKIFVTFVLRRQSLWPCGWLRGGAGERRVGTGH